MPHQKVLFFGEITSRLGHERAVHIPPDGCSIAQLRQLLGANDAIALATLMRPAIKASVDQAIVGDETIVQPGQEVAFFSPLSGG